eukprot:7021564-Lingulodinium_polyedra.AAC.1
MAPPGSMLALLGTCLGCTPCPAPAPVAVLGMSPRHRRRRTLASRLTEPPEFWPLFNKARC